jgi:peptide chain release factor 1
VFWPFFCSGVAGDGLVRNGWDRVIDNLYIEKLKERVAALESDIANPALASNQKKFRDVVKEHLRTRRILEKATGYLRIKRDFDEHRELLSNDSADPDLKALASEEFAELEAALPKAEKELQAAMLPPDPNDERDVIMEIRAGTGGEEASLFAADLFRMYSRYCEGRNWKVSVIDASSSSIGGYKEVVCSVQGNQVYSVMKYESGCHRVQRVPVTESSGRIHTSAATVAVLPEVDEMDDIVIPADELRVDIFCSSGPGGQGVNTTYSAVRVTHLPTGLVAQSQDERSQHRNKEKALSVLKARLLDWKQRQEEERSGNLRRTQIGSGDRSEKIRTYNFPQNRLTDHRINYTIYTLNRVMEGGIDELIQALRDHDLALRVKKEMAAAKL